ncbi:F-box domain-containing protein [Mycena kentingensis (nom. inval.)]|nr:F-box domain-containing protein [Mycena kentingensis (nom. inval.)]
MAAARCKKRYRVKPVMGDRRRCGLSADIDVERTKEPWLAMNLPNAPVKDRPFSANDTLPPEILAHIFRFFRYLDGNLDSPDPAQSPQPLLYVCRSWRNAARSCSELWTHLILRLEHETLPNNLMDHLGEWLARASNRALSLEIWGPCSDKEFDFDDLYDVFDRYSARMKQLTLRNLSAEHMEIFDAWELPFPALEAVELSVGEAHEYVASLDVLTTAPNLRSIALANISLEYVMLNASKWQRMTAFKTYWTIERTEYIELVQKLPQLQVFHASLQMAVQDSIEPPPLGGPILSVVLEELSLDAESGIDVASFLNAFTFPRLRMLKIFLTGSPNSTLDVSAPSITSFLERSQPPLERLQFPPETLLSVSAFTRHCPVTVLELLNPTTDLVTAFFSAYSSEKDFCASVATLELKVFITNDHAPDKATMSWCVRNASPYIKRRRALLGAPPLREFRVTFSPEYSEALDAYDERHADWDAWDELRADGMEIYFGQESRYE